MANGSMGRKCGEETKNRAMVLITKNVTIPQVAQRLGISESVVRNWVRDSKKSKEDKA